MACQWMPNKKPPIIGATAGAIPNNICTVAITRCAWGPSNKSRTIARATVLPAPPLAPCNALKNQSVSTLGANAQPMLARNKYTQAPLNGGDTANGTRRWRHATTSSRHKVIGKT